MDNFFILLSPAQQAAMQLVKEFLARSAEVEQTSGPAAETLEEIQ